MRRLLLLGLAALLVAVVPARGSAQLLRGVYNPRDADYRLLGLVRAQANYERAKQAYERAKKLYEEHVITAQELEKKRVAFERARVNYLQQSLAVIFAAPHVTIKRAVKGRAPDGGSFVRLTLVNTTASGELAGRASELINEDLIEQLEPDVIKNVYVSLKSEPGRGGAIISMPYERRIPAMEVGEPVTLRFGLLRDDVSEVVVSINYADKVAEKTVYLETDASADIVAVQSIQFSQEADLGARATYDLQLEQYASGRGAVQLAAVGLPRGIRTDFRDPETGARLSQIRFPEGQSQKKLQLVVSLPRRAAGAFEVDEPIRFWVLALDREAQERLRRLQAQDSVTAEEIASLNAGKARLELIPRGIGRIQVRALNLYHEIAPDDSVVMDVTLRNVGSRTLTNVRLDVHAPLGWDARVEPEYIAELGVGEEDEMRVVLDPPADAVVGDYEATIETESAAADRRVEAEEKTVRVHIASGTNWLGTAALGLLLVGLVGGVVYGGVRLARR